MAMGFNSELENENKTDPNPHGKEPKHGETTKPMPPANLESWEVTIDLDATSDFGCSVKGDIVLCVNDDRGRGLVLMLNCKTAKQMAKALKNIAEVSKLNNEVYC